MAPSHHTQLAPETFARPAWRRLFPVLALVAAAWFCVHWLTAEDHAQLVQGEAPLLTLQAFDGSTIDLAALRGQPLVVNFWASWCEPCRVEAELFERAWVAERSAQTRSGENKGILFIGVNHQDTLVGATAFIEEFGVSYPNGADVTGEWSRGFGVFGLPSTFFIDAEGQIQTVMLGPVTGARELEAQLQKIRLEGAR
jgi:cytochrome c biogenesis protein CcmG/thiol:disulfide interchange protein DsbE